MSWRTATCPAEGTPADGDVDDGRPTRERVMVALTGGPEGQALIRRAARIAARSGGDLLAVHVARPGGPADAAAIALAAQRRLTESIGGTYHQLADLDIPDALLTLARTENATQLVLGRRNRTRLGALRPRTRIRSRVIRGSSGTDVHIITHPAKLSRCRVANTTSVRYQDLYFLTDRLSARSPGSCADNAGAPSDSGFVKSTQKTTVPIQQT
jgi:K+-sensing histidine kinase KdpD